MTNEEFLEEEIRDEFVVTVERKKLWKTFIDIYNELIRVCDKYSLKVFANGGTLLGAIRHSGFIPWDDDFDVAMSREDFDKLCEVSAKEFKYPYFFQYALSDRNYFIGIARLRRSDTTGIITFLCDHIYNNGIYLDIYVYDKIPYDERELKRTIKKVKRISYFLDNYYHYNNKNKKISFLRPIFALTKYFISYDKLYEIYKKVCTKYKNDNTNRLGFLCMPYFIKYEETVEGINNLSKHKFEYFEINIPSDWSETLKKSYGNYMKFPPIEQRGKWHENIIIYDTQISFYDYYEKYPEKFSSVLKEIKQKGKIEY